jgi:DNA-binding beta-propeller fold protein YncE
MTTSLEVESSPETIQSFVLPDALTGSEGIAYSPAGDVMAVATSDTNRVFLFRRRLDGQFETTPFSHLGGSDSPLRYPHDVSFTTSGDGELLAVAQRTGVIAVYQRNPLDGTYGPAPVFEIRGPETRLKFSDGVTFVPPHYDHLAACNRPGTVSFYRQVSRAPVRFALKPVFVLQHPSIDRPDGLGFSACGRWLAVANHGRHTVSIYRRRPRPLSLGRLEYGPEPVTIIDDASLCHPHSVAFNPGTNHLAVTNAGANYFSVYQPIGRGRNLRWSRLPSLKTIVAPEAVFTEVNSLNTMEGGPKGIAIHRDRLAICNPDYGVKIYRIRESGLSPA